MYAQYIRKNCSGILMKAIFLEPIAGLFLVASQMWIGKKITSSIKIPIAEFFVVSVKNKPNPKTNSILPNI